MLLRPTPLRKSRQESLPGYNLIALQFHVKQLPGGRRQRFLDLSQPIPIEGKDVWI